jgi:cation transport protein ChaC
MRSEPASAQPFWVFGYGSLLWNPGFEFVESRLARLSGYRRAFCMSSIKYRGTPQRPGLVLALDRDDQGACTGLAYKVSETIAEATLAYLRERELISYAYEEMRLPLQFEDGGAVEAVCFVMRDAHPQYCGGLSLDEQADVIATAVGPNGPNSEYLMNTVQSLERLGLHDPDLTRLAAMVGERLQDQDPKS